jgi:hypothetical protein
MIDPVANEAAMRHLTGEIHRLEMLLAQAIGNLALANARLAELEQANVIRLPEEGEA